MVQQTVLTRLITSAPWVFVMLWSTGYVGARFGLPYADPITFTALRFGIVTVLLALLSIVRRVPLPRSGVMWVHLMVSGTLLHAVFIGCVFSAVGMGINIGVASLIAGAQPLLTAVLVLPMLGERLNARQWCGFAIGFAGIALVVSKSFQLGTLDWTPLLLCVTALFAISIGTVYQKRFVVGTDLIAGSVVQFGTAAILCTGYAWLFEDGRLEWNLTLGLTLAWLCLVLSMGAILIFLYLVRAGAAARVSSLFYLVPPATALQGYLLFGEALSVQQMLGMLVAAVGVAMINLVPATTREAVRNDA